MLNTSGQKIFGETRYLAGVAVFSNVLIPEHYHCFPLASELRWTWCALCIRLACDKLQHVTGLVTGLRPSPSPRPRPSARLGPGPGPAQARPKPGPDFGIQKIEKMEILKIQIHSAQNVGKVWIRRNKKKTAPFGGISGQCFHGP